MFDWVVVQELVAKAAALDAGAAGDDELLAAARALASVRGLADAALGHVLAELDRRDVTDRTVGLPTGMWFARAAGVPVAAGRERVRVARVLGDRLHEVDEAVTAGRLSWDHATVLARACHPRVADRVAEVQDELISLADGAVFDAWRRQVQGIVALLDEDGAFDPDAELARNHLSLSPTIDGLTHLTGALAGEHAEVARQAIEATTDELFRRFTADHDRTPDIAVPSRRVLRALAFVELCRRGQAVDLRSSTCPRPDVTLVVHAHEPDQAYSRDGIALADGTTRTLRCDPDLTAVVVDRLGVPLDMGRRTRYATSAQRRALAVRDGGCIFPGCDVPVSWCDSHHVREFQHGGRTDLATLATLCRHHHGVTHRHGWRLRPVGDGRFSWTTPSGQTLRSQRHGRIEAEPP